MWDFHARLGPRADATGRLLDAMATAGIARAVVCAGGLLDLDRISAQIEQGGGVAVTPDNERVRSACAGSDGRLVPFWFGNPYDDGPAEYRRDAHRFRGLEVSPAVHGLGFDDPRVVGLVETAAAAGHPVYTVCLGRPGTRPADLVRLAQAFPTTTFVFGHCGFTGIDLHALAQIAPQRNIMAETSGCFTVTARAAVDRLGPDRVLFGTEYPLQHPRVELAKLAALELPAPVWHQVAWANAMRLLGES